MNKYIIKYNHNNLGVYLNDEYLCFDSARKYLCHTSAYNKIYHTLRYYIFNIRLTLEYYIQPRNMA